jgi:hypothetical protein
MAVKEDASSKVGHNARRHNDWATAALSSVGIAVVAIVCAWLTNQSCNHLPGAFAVAQPHTPRGDWCAVVNSHTHWLALVMVAPALTLILVRVSARRYRLFIAVGVASLLVLQTLIIADLRPEIIV